MEFWNTCSGFTCFEGEQDLIVSVSPKCLTCGSPRSGHLLYIHGIKTTKKKEKQSHGFRAFSAVIRFGWAKGCPDSW